MMANPRQMKRWQLGIMLVLLAWAVSACSLLESATDEALLAFLVIRVKAFDKLSGLWFVEQCDSVVGLLAMVADLVAQFVDRFLGEIIVRHFCFLQANKLRLVIGNHSVKLMHTSPYAVHVERNDFHKTDRG